MARVTFVYPDFESLGVEYLMAICSSVGHDVNFVYYEAEDTYLRMTKNVRYEEIATEIHHTRPDIVAFSCVTDNYQYQLRCAESLKKKQSNIYTIFGGVHPTSVPEKVLRYDVVDAVAIGEAEHSLLELLQASGLRGRFSFPDAPIPGIIFKKSGRIIGSRIEGRLVDLDSLPFPQKTPYYSILKDSIHEYMIMTSRGCPNYCSYCFNSLIFNLRGNKVVIRRRSVANVIAELNQAKNKLAAKRVLFLDDSFTTDKSWIKNFCERYRTEINLPFACVAIPGYVDEDIAKTLASAGCVNMQLGIQSLSETLCSEILHRKSLNWKIEEAIHILKRHNIMVQVDHMLGIPGDTMKNQEDGICFYNIHRPNLISVLWLTYYPKTPIVDIAQKKGVITQDDIEHIEQGIRLTKESIYTGGSLQNPSPYYSVSFLLGWLPLLPKCVVKFLLKSRAYRIFRIKNYFLSIALPRIIQSLSNKRDFRGRSHMFRFFSKLFRRQKSYKFYKESSC